MQNKQTTIVIEQLVSFSSKLFLDIQRLAAMIGSNYKKLHEEDLKEIISSSNMTLLVAKDNDRIVGMVTLLVYRIPYVRKAYIDDLVVDEAYRGQGLGTKLMQEALLFAQKKRAAYIDFTSRARRIESNRLYEKLGFTKRSTNVYRKIIDYAEV